MAGFRKAKAEQAFVKLGVYGPAGKGKTFTSLLIAEGLAKKMGKRVAYFDSERGTDFYCQTVPDRAVHPEAFDFDAIYSKSIVEVLDAVRTIDTNLYGVLVIDSISHIWDACIAAYKGKRTSIDSIPMHAWGEIKKPYKELMSLILSAPMHVIICGRQANEFGKDDSTGELTKVGVKMRAEGETQYEPHITIRMDDTRATKGKGADILAIVEKDRTGVLAGKIIVNPTFDSLIKPILPLLGGNQAKVETEDAVGSRDAEAMAKEEHDKIDNSAVMLRDFNAQFDLAKTEEAVEKVSKTITADVKKAMLSGHVTELRAKYQDSIARVKGRRTVTTEQPKPLAIAE